MYTHFPLRKGIIHLLRQSLVFWNIQVTIIHFIILYVQEFQNDLVGGNVTLVCVSLQLWMFISFTFILFIIHHRNVPKNTCHLLKQNLVDTKNATGRQTDEREEITISYPVTLRNAFTHCARKTKQNLYYQLISTNIMVGEKRHGAAIERIRWMVLPILWF